MELPKGHRGVENRNDLRGSVPLWQLFYNAS